MMVFSPVALKMKRAKFGATPLRPTYDFPTRYSGAVPGLLRLGLAYNIMIDSIAIVC